MQDVIDKVWTALESATTQRGSPFAIVQAATIGLDGSPMVRTVVLRNVSRQHNSVCFHSDLRAAKIAELRRDSRISLVGYDRGKGVQIRMTGTAHLITDGPVKESLWNSATVDTRSLYQSATPPGMPLDATNATRVEHEDPDDNAYKNFCVVNVSLTFIDFLQLHPIAHERAQLHLREHAWTGIWVTP